MTENGKLRLEIASRLLAGAMTHDPLQTDGSFNLKIVKAFARADDLIAHAEATDELGELTGTVVSDEIG